MKKDKGFTLIEVIVVVSIILIITSVAIPVTLGHLRKSTERKYVIEGKIIESAVEMYNLEVSSNKIKDKENLLSVKGKLENGERKYITSWPNTLKGKMENDEVEISLSDLDSYKLEDIINYVKEKESESF